MTDGRGDISGAGVWGFACSLCDSVFSLMSTPPTRTGHTTTMGKTAEAEAATGAMTKHQLRDGQCNTGSGVEDVLILDACCETKL